jgi:hypothetical protein
MGSHAHTSNADFVDRKREFVPIIRRIYIVRGRQRDSSFPNKESMISQVIVRVVDENAEHDAPEELQAVVVSMPPLRLQ